MQVILRLFIFIFFFKTSNHFLYSYSTIYRYLSLLIDYLFELILRFQQSMQENNNTTPTTTSTIFLRDIDQPIVIDSKEEEKRDETKRDGVITVKSKIQRLNSQYIK